MPKAMYDGVEIWVSEPRLWPIEWINFRLHPCTDWSGVQKYHDRVLEPAPILICKDCFVVLDGWHRLANWWQEGKRRVWVQFADFHLGGAVDECHVNNVNWISTLRPWTVLNCVSGSYLEHDFRELCFATESATLKGFGDNKMPLMRQWEHVRATIFLGVVQNHKILDVGTRESILPTYLSSMGASVTATDISTVQIKSGPGIHVQTADATDLPFEDNSFDDVICTACIKHIPEDGKAVSEMLRVLKPNGLLAITFDFGKEYEEFPSKTTGRRIYDANSVYERLVIPFRDIATLCQPADFTRNDWNDWPIKAQAPAVFAKGVNVQVASVLLRKKDSCV